jgi:outer membrane protein insertion porin family
MCRRSIWAKSSRHRPITRLQRDCAYRHLFINCRVFSRGRSTGGKPTSQHAVASEIAYGFWNPDNFLAGGPAALAASIRCLAIMRLPVLILMIIVAVAAASAQLDTLRPQAVYDGQNVDAVDLIGNPHRDLTPLFAVVVQRAHERYSQAKVEASIRALQKAGGFLKVTVQIVPDTTGLRLDFLLEPAYYIGVVNFPGAIEKFTYMRMLQVANLADEDPFDAARLPVAEQALRDFYRHNGYFQASVQAATEIDDQHQLVNVNFNVHLGKQARVGKVEIQGVAAPEAAGLLRSLRSLRARLTGGLLKRGKPYNEERIKAATALIKRTLTQQHRLASVVLANSPVFHPDNARVDVSFKIEPGPIVVVRTEGAKLSSFSFIAGRQIKKLVPIYSEGTIDRDLVEEGQQNLVDYFQKKGYADVKVAVDYKEDPNQISVVYRIDRGRKHKVESIDFHGNHEISDHDLMAVVVTKRSHLWTHGSVSPKLLKQSVQNLEGLYRDKGYESAKVNVRVVADEVKLNINFDIEEGAQTLVDNLEITGNTSVPQDELTLEHGFGLKPGGPYSARQLSEDRNRISATYLDRGYLNAEVKATITRRSEDRHRVIVAFAINEHQRVSVSNVLYLGQNQTRLALITKTTNIPAAAPMRKVDLLGAESRLYDLNVFDWASVGPQRPITDQSDENVLVKVHEAKRNDITYGFGFEVSRRGGNVPAGTVAVPGLPPIELGKNQVAPSEATFASPLGSIAFSRRNLRGLAETASASILLSRLDQRFLATYMQPHFKGSQWSSLTSFSIERNSENPLFTANLGDLSFQVERRISRKHNTRLQVRYDFNQTKLSNLLVSELVLPQDQNVHLSTFSSTLIEDTRDKPLDAHRGMYGTLNFAVTPRWLGSSASMAKAFGQIAYYKPVHSLVFANRISLGLASALAGSFVPTSQLFFSGGGTSLRGFPIDEAGPQRLVPFCNVLQNETGCVNVTVPVGGRQIFILNSEMRFPTKITKAIGGVIFYDGGNVYSAINFNNFVDNYSNTVGVGLRYSTPIGPIRIDIGRNLNPVPGLSSTQYFITLGQAF